jgi:hypothetical protein
MNPILDQVLVGAAILGALSFFVIRALRSRRKNSCGGGCCSAATPMTHLKKRPD